MSRRLTEPDDRLSPGDAREERNRRVLIGFLLLCSIALLLVSTMPLVLVPPVLSQVLAWCSFGAALVAGIRRERPMSDHLTSWDQAAGLLALSLFAGFFTDITAVSEFMEALSVTGQQAPEGVGVAPALPGDG